MSKFQVLQPTTSQLYWYELASYVAPYATVGSFIITAGMTFLDHSDEDRHNEVINKLNEISQQIESLRLSVERKIDETVLKARTGEVLGIKEALNEYKHLRSQGILDNIITSSATTKQQINSFLESPETSLQYYLAYNALKCLLLPLRIAVFGLYIIPKADYLALIKEELKDLLSDKQKKIELMRQVGINRVSMGRRVEVIDELGPRYGIELWVDVDGQPVWRAFNTQPDKLQEIYRDRESVFESTKETMAVETSKTDVQFYEAAQAFYDELP